MEQRKLDKGSLESDRIRVFASSIGAECDDDPKKHVPEPVADGCIRFGDTRVLLQLTAYCNSADHRDNKSRAGLDELLREACRLREMPVRVMVHRRSDAADALRLPTGRCAKQAIEQLLDLYVQEGKKLPGTDGLPLGLTMVLYPGVGLPPRHKSHLREVWFDSALYPAIASLGPELDVRRVSCHDHVQFHIGGVKYAVVDEELLKRCYSNKCNKQAFKSASPDGTPIWLVITVAGDTIDGTLMDDEFDRAVLILQEAASKGNCPFDRVYLLRHFASEKERNNCCLIHSTGR